MNRRALLLSLLLLFPTLAYGQKTQEDADNQYWQALEAEMDAHAEHIGYEIRLETYNEELTITNASPADLATAAQLVADAAIDHALAQSRIDNATNVEMPVGDVLYDAENWGGAWHYYFNGWVGYHFAWHDYRHGANPKLDQAIELIMD